MWLEDLLILVIMGLGIFFVGIPLIKLLKRLTPEKRNPLAEAKEKLEQAKLEVEAAKLNKEVEQVYSTLYEDVLNEDNNDKQKKG